MLNRFWACSCRWARAAHWMRGDWGERPPEAGERDIGARGRSGANGGGAPALRGAAARAWLASPEAHPRPEGRPVPSPRRYLRRVQPAGSRTEMVQGVQPCAGGPTSGDGTSPDNQRSLPRPLSAGVRSAQRWRQTQALSPRATRARAPVGDAGVCCGVGLSGNAILLLPIYKYALLLWRGGRRPGWVTPPAHRGTIAPRLPALKKPG